MNCIFCDKPVTNRKKGDHIIPQGLGKFLPELTIYSICKDCDSKNGSNFERIALKTGMLGTFRAIKGIKSRNSRNKPLNSPSLDKFKSIESHHLSITDSENSNESFYISGKGKIRYSDLILIKKNGETIDTIRIPPTRDIREICNFIEAKIPEKIDSIECELHINDEQVDLVLNELKRRGRKIAIPVKLKQSNENKLLIIRSLITENHFRFVASTVLKGMIFLKYSKNLLMPMIDYVKTGNSSNLNYHFIDEVESGMDAYNDPPLHLFYHKFEWEINENSILIVASILAHKKVNGIRMKLSVKAGKDNTILLPFGKIVAQYGNTPSDGVLELFHGANKIIQCSI